MAASYTSGAGATSSARAAEGFARTRRWCERRRVPQAPGTGRHAPPFPLRHPRAQRGDPCRGGFQAWSGGGRNTRFRQRSGGGSAAAWVPGLRPRMTRRRGWRLDRQRLVRAPTLVRHDRRDPPGLSPPGRRKGGHAPPFPLRHPRAQRGDPCRGGFQAWSGGGRDRRFLQRNGGGSAAAWVPGLRPRMTRRRGWRLAGRRLAPRRRRSGGAAERRRGSRFCGERKRRSLRRDRRRSACENARCRGRRPVRWSSSVGLGSSRAASPFSLSSVSVCRALRDGGRNAEGRPFDWYDQDGPPSAFRAGFLDPFSPGAARSGRAVVSRLSGALRRSASSFACHRHASEEAPMAAGASQGLAAELKRTDPQSPHSGRRAGGASGPSGARRLRKEPRRRRRTAGASALRRSPLGPRTIPAIVRPVSRAGGERMMRAPCSRVGICFLRRIGRSFALQGFSAPKSLERRK